MMVGTDNARYVAELHPESFRWGVVDHALMEWVGYYLSREDAVAAAASANEVTA